LRAGARATATLRALAGRDWVGLCLKRSTTSSSWPFCFLHRFDGGGTEVDPSSLLHQINPELLRAALYALKRDAASGIDGMTWETYEQVLHRRLEDLHASVQTGAYRAQPSRRSFIPKEDGSKRPLASHST
jgi:hypothetical protein